MKLPKKKLPIESQEVTRSDMAHALQQIVSSQLDLRGTLDLVALHTQELTGGEGASVELIEGEQTVPRGASGMAAIAPFQFPLESSLSGEAVRRNQTLYSEDCDADKRVNRAACDERGTRAIIVAPLHACEKTVGVLKVVSKQPEAFSRGDLDKLQILAESLSAIIRHREAMEQLRRAEFQYNLMFANNPQPMWVYDVSTLRFIAVNQAAVRHYGYSEKKFLSMTLRDLHPAEDIAALEHALGLVRKRRKTPRIWRHRKKDGSVIMVEVIAERIDYNGADARLVQINDVTSRLHAEQEIRQLAFHDPLTGLPNRLLLLDRLQQAMASCKRNRTTGALLFIDVDNFKVLNDTLGHDQGDVLLQQISARLLSCVSDTDTTTRFGGDEFVVLQEGLSEEFALAADAAMLLAQELIAVFRPAFQLQDVVHYCTASIGIAVFNEHSGSVDDILKRADMAMFQAKASGRNTMRFFDPEMQRRVNERATMEVDLRRALENNEFVLYYQPQTEGEDSIYGAEALLRWQHPTRGMILPQEFISLSEETGLIVPLGQWIFEEACSRLAAWAGSDATKDLTLSVNVSAGQFGRPDFVENVCEILARTGANPERLKLELTESLMVEDVEATIDKMAALRTMGIRFALDDFGTGYSSLGYLKRLPLSQLKIDQSFVRDVLTDPNDAAIVRMVIVLGQTLGLSVIAEGVETRFHQEFLARHGCLRYQGYLFGVPMSAMQFEQLVNKSLHFPAHGEST